jgi:hypothetical protein
MLKLVLRSSIVLLLCMVLLAVPAFAQPPSLPHSFYGAVTVDGQPAPIGVQIEVRGAGVLDEVQGNPLSVTQFGRYGGPGAFDPKLMAQGDIMVGAPLEFYVDGVRAQCALPGGAWQMTFPFDSGEITELNLLVGDAPVPVGRIFLPLIFRLYMY